MFNLNKYEYYEDINLGLLKYCPENKFILDVGCGSGLLGKMYREKNNIVYGIDSARDIQLISEKRLDKFYLENILDYSKINKLLKNKKFDIIIFADVLEHLYDPLTTLNFYKQLLKPKGLFYISVPNIAVWYVRIALLLGKFNYQETGTLDKTHIRFFTYGNLKILAKEAKLKIVKKDITPGIFRFFIPLLKKYLFKKKKSKSTIIDSSLYKTYIRFIYPIEYFFSKIVSGLLSFQYIVILKK